MSDYLVASLTPQLLDIHGDAQNAQVLAARARWAGHDSRVVEVHTARDAAELQPQAITIGSGFDSDAAEVLAALKPIAESIAAWVATGTPLLAIGLGWELLSVSTEFADGTTYHGLGIFSGRFVASNRAVGPMVLDSDFGRLVGYEYHYRDYVLGEGEQALGRVEAGTGNRFVSDGERREGAVRGTVFGTTLRGPVLGRNARFADHLLAQFSPTTTPSSDREIADQYAQRANRRVLDTLGVFNT